MIERCRTFSTDKVCDYLHMIYNEDCSYKQTHCPFEYGEEDECTYSGEEDCNNAILAWLFEEIDE